MISTSPKTGTDPPTGSPLTMLNQAGAWPSGGRLRIASTTSYHYCRKDCHSVKLTDYVTIDASREAHDPSRLVCSTIPLQNLSRDSFLEATSMHRSHVQVHNTPQNLRSCRCSFARARIPGIHSVNKTRVLPPFCFPEFLSLYPSFHRQICQLPLPILHC